MDEIISSWVENFNNLASGDDQRLSKKFTELYLILIICIKVIVTSQDLDLKNKITNNAYYRQFEYQNYPKKKVQVIIKTTDNELIKNEEGYWKFINQVGFEH
ncbi:hypothetical protein BpHYR1_039208 [Brachionus plicatilis]|uniref:Uncharacterized protein n=1 Tax=Brachionus plicatilis TaxID=10195 RepID=A0A3M7QVS5_BRAPC|nr:hypothetical protein BpHYR1_039208 [Brachionus plicatilis]